MECWNTGYKKRKKIYSTKNVVSTFYDDTRQTSIFCFRPQKIRHYYEKINTNYIRFDSLNPPFHYPRTHDSNIPEFQHSNWGEAPNLIHTIETNYLSVTGRQAAAYICKASAMPPLDCSDRVREISRPAAIIWPPSHRWVSRLKNSVFSIWQTPCNA